MAVPSRSDEQNRALLARLKPEHENLRRSHIRSEADAERAAEELARIDALETGERGGPDPDAITLETFGREIPEA